MRAPTPDEHGVATNAARDHDQRGEVHLAPEEPQRRRRRSTATPLVAAAQTDPPLVRIGRFAQLAPRLTRVVGAVQRAAAVGTPVELHAKGALPVDLAERVEELPSQVVIVRQIVSSVTFPGFGDERPREVEWSTSRRRFAIWGGTSATIANTGVVALADDDGSGRRSIAEPERGEVISPQDSWAC